VLARIVHSIDRRAMVVGLGAAIVLLAVLGAVMAWDPRPALRAFDLDEERTVPAVFSALLLLACALVALCLPRANVRRGIAIAFALLLAFAALDEFAEIHEQLERELGVDWQVLYAPFFAAAFGLWVFVLRGIRRSPGLPVMIASGACWALAQVLEKAQWSDDGAAPGYAWMMVTEEILEMTGSALLLLALVVVVQAERLPR
jgi:hypothetical protein